MEQFIIFNGVKVLLTTGETLSEVQNLSEEADVIISVYPGRVQILKQTAAFTCPRCRKTSYNPHDILQHYCGNCHAFAADMGVKA